VTRPHTSPLYHNEQTHAADVPVKAACAYVWQAGCWRPNIAASAIYDPTSSGNRVPVEGW